MEGSWTFVSLNSRLMGLLGQHNREEELPVRSLANTTVVGVKNLLNTQLSALSTQHSTLDT
jgi:hypothetical protein